MPIVDMCDNFNGTLLWTISLDKSLKIFDFINFDMINVWTKCHKLIPSYIPIMIQCRHWPCYSTHYRKMSILPQTWSRTCTSLLRYWLSSIGLCLSFIEYKYLSILRLKTIILSIAFSKNGRPMATWSRDRKNTLVQFSSREKSFKP